MFRHMTGKENLSDCFIYELELLSTDGDIKLDKVIGRHLTVAMEMKDGKTRHFDGLVTHMSHQGMRQGFDAYKVTLRPWLWFLTRNDDCRIFQQKSVVDIIKTIFADASFTDYKLSLTQSYQPRPYCVQYSETDYHFISRLLAQEGIYYYFTHEKGKHTLVLVDSLSGHKDAPGYKKVRYHHLEREIRLDQDHLWSWQHSQQVRTGQVCLDDYDYERAKAKLQAKAKDAADHPYAGFEHYEYPGLYSQASQGDTYATIRLQEQTAQRETCTGQSNARGLGTGFLFSLTEYPRKDQNREYLITGADFTLHLEDQEREGQNMGDAQAGTEDSFIIDLRCLDSAVPYRPPRRYPPPRIMGPQTALVVGKSGEEIWTDSFGRIKVQFRWDRLGKMDENSSCWLRVAQQVAGQGWGQLVLPRIGQEVLVEFLDGDPDRPIITGSVYNDINKPPQSLPNRASATTWRSQSMKDGNNKTYNEITLEDKKGEEEILIHAEKNFQLTIENNVIEKIGFEKKEDGDQTVDIYNNRTVTLEQGDDALLIKKGGQTVTLNSGDQTTTLDKGARKTEISQGNDTLKLGQGSRTTTLTSGDDSLTLSSGNFSLQTKAGKSTITAGQAIELKVGGSSVLINQQGVTIKGMQVKIEGTAMMSVKAPMTTVSGDGMLTVKGGLVKIN